jgi:hypothetical protein
MNVLSFFVKYSALRQRLEEIFEIEYERFSRSTACNLITDAADHGRPFQITKQSTGRFVIRVDEKVAFWPKL